MEPVHVAWRKRHECTVAFETKARARNNKQGGRSPASEEVAQSIRSFLSPVTGAILCLMKLFLELGWIGYVDTLPPHASSPVSICDSERPLKLRLAQSLTGISTTV